MVAVAVVGSAVIGAAASSRSSSRAARAQTQAADASIDFQRESRDQALALQAPYRNASYAATSALMDLTGLPRTRSAIDMSMGEDGAYEMAPDLSSFPKYSYQQDPGYRARLDEGTKTLERGAAARGGLLSGGYGRRAIRYAQDYASNEYQNVYNRIASIAGFGQTATNASTNVIVGTGQNVGNALVNAGEARASGYVAQGNAWSNAANQIGMAYGSGMFGGVASGGNTVAMNYQGPAYGGGLA